MGSFFKYWMPLFLWIAVIFVGSTDVMSAEQTSRFIAPFLRWLKPDVTAAMIAQVQFFVRKAAHLGEYAILAMMLWRAARHGTNIKVKMSILFVLVWVACAMFAAADEFHQSFVPTRTAAFGDVLIDMCGAIAGLIVCMMFVARGRSRSLNQETRKPPKER
jgi:VanZ family protein